MDHEQEAKRLKKECGQLRDRGDVLEAVNSALCRLNEAMEEFIDLRKKYGSTPEFLSVYDAFQSIGRALANVDDEPWKKAVRTPGQSSLRIATGQVDTSEGAE